MLFFTNLNIICDYFINRWCVFLNYYGNQISKIFFYCNEIIIIPNYNKIIKDQSILFFFKKHQ